GGCGCTARPQPEPPASDARRGREVAEVAVEAARALRHLEPHVVVARLAELLVMTQAEARAGLAGAALAAGQAGQHAEGSALIDGNLPQPGVEAVAGRLRVAPVVGVVGKVQLAGGRGQAHAGAVAVELLEVRVDDVHVRAAMKALADPE